MHSTLKSAISDQILMMLRLGSGPETTHTAAEQVRETDTCTKVQFEDLDAAVEQIREAQYACQRCR